AAILRDPPTLGVVAGAIVFTAAATAAEFKPVPLDESGTRMVSLSFVFLLAAQLLFGWELAVLAAVVAIGSVGHVEKAPLVRRGFNVATYALAVLASALPGLVLGIEPSAFDPSVNDSLAGLAFVGGALYVMVNLGLVSAVVALATGD